MSWKPGTVTKRRRGKARPASSTPSSATPPAPPSPPSVNAPAPQPPQLPERGRNVAVIGGGISGLSCAVRLKELGYTPTVFDTGRKAVGGRCSSRREEIEHGSGKGKGKQSKGCYGDIAYRFDHSAQCIAVAPDDSEFAALVDRWVAAGALKQWKGNFCKISCSASGASPSIATPLAPTATTTASGAGADTPLSAPAPVLWIGADGMESLPQHLSKGTAIVRFFFYKQIAPWVDVDIYLQSSQLYRTLPRLLRSILTLQPVLNCCRHLFSW